MRPVRDAFPKVYVACWGAMPQGKAKGHTPRWDVAL